MLSSFAQRVWDYARHERLLQRGDRVLLAVSGGPDSMALLEVMRELSPARDLKIHVVHVHHMLRGQEADADLRFVRRYCGFVGVPFSSSRVNVPARRAMAGGSLEETARTLRYQSLDHSRRARRMDVIATAHHADDQTETVLMRVARGTDIRGLAGILPRLSAPAVIRPLLRCTRAEILTYLEDRRAPYRIDTSNEDIRMTRNAVRQVVVPHLLRSGHQHMLAVIPHLADLARRFSMLLRQTLPSALGEDAPVHHGFRRVHIGKLMALPPGLRRAYVGHMLSDNGTELSSGRIERVLDLVSSAPGKRIIFRGAGLQVVRDREHLAFGPIAGRSGRPARLRPGERVVIGGGTVHAHPPSALPGRLGSDRNVAWIDAETVRGPLLVRSWRSGDRMMPIGMHGRSKKVSDVLRDSRIPLYYKESVPVVVSAGRIVWVCGVRLDDRFKLVPGTARAMQISYTPPA